MGPLVISLQESLTREDQQSLQKAVAVTLAMDERDQCLAVMGKWTWFEGNRVKEVSQGQQSTPTSTIPLFK